MSISQNLIFIYEKILFIFTFLLQVSTHLGHYTQKLLREFKLYIWRLILY